MSIHSNNVETDRRPKVGQLEERQAPAVVADGKKIRRLIPYSTESRDLGGWREVIAPGALNRTKLDDLVVTVDHAGVPLGRYPGTLEIEDRADGMHWSVDPPESRSDVREAVERGDLRGGSWRMVVGRDEWRGDTRHVLEISELRDVSVVTTGAYPAEVAPVELRSNPDNETAESAEKETKMEVQDERVDRAQEAGEDRSQPPGGLKVEDRQVKDDKGEKRSFGEIVVESIRDVKVGETRSLASAGSPLSPPELSSQLFQALRASSIALQTGIPVIATDREQIQWPKLNTDVSPPSTARAARSPRAIRGSSR